MPIKMSQRPPRQINGNKVNFAMRLLALSLARQKRTMEIATANVPRKTMSIRIHFLVWAVRDVMGIMQLLRQSGE